MSRDKGHLVITDDPNDDVAIRVEGVSKSFRLPHNRQNSIKGSLINLVSRGDRTYETQDVLKDVSFEIKKGEFIGIVGRNGSGKSTLLKMLAGIYTPSKGKIIVNGSLTPFIELGVGFNPELTGRENVYLNGALLGFNERDVDTMYDDIVAFAELERFMDQKLKNYSSGMQVRLAFSIAIRAKSDILVLDEVLAVGDEAFQRKCHSYFATLKRKKKTVILVTHDMNAVEKFCSRGIFIDNGDLVLQGSANKIASAYRKSNEEVYNPSRLNSSELSQQATDLKIELKNASGEEANKYTTGDTMTIELRWQNPLVKASSVTIVTENGVKVFGAGTYQDKYIFHKINYLRMRVKLNLLEGVYFLQVGLGEEGKAQPVAFIENGPVFVVNKRTNMPAWDGITLLEHSWSQ